MSSRGFTLIEMLTSLIILAILLAACGSMIAMASKAVSDGAVRTQTQLQSIEAAEQMTDDLNVATNFTEHTATAATFTVPDRLGTGAPQTVRYAWAGPAGAPLTRQYNGGTATSILPSVQNLSLLYNFRSAGSAPATAEQVIYSHDAQVGTLQNFSITTSAWGSQYFNPNVSLFSLSYSITRVRLMLKAGSQGDALNVSIRLAGTLQKPSSTVLAQATVYQSALSSAYEWIDVPISDLSNLDPLVGLCVMLKPETSSTNVGAWQTDKVASSINLNEDWSTTTNAGSSWSAGVNTTTARFYIYGTVP